MRTRKTWLISSSLPSTCLLLLLVDDVWSLLQLLWLCMSERVRRWTSREIKGEGMKDRILRINHYFTSEWFTHEELFAKEVLQETKRYAQRLPNMNEESLLQRHSLVANHALWSESRVHASLSHYEGRGYKMAEMREGETRREGRERDTKMQGNQGQYTWLQAAWVSLLFSLREMPCKTDGKAAV